MSQNFKVTMGRDGTRTTYTEHDDRWQNSSDNYREGQNSSDNYRGGQNSSDNYRGGGRNQRSRGGGGNYRGGRGGNRGMSHNYRGKFKGSSYNNKKRGGWRGGGGPSGPSPRSRFTDDDGDVSMGAEEGPSTSRYSPYGSGPRRPGGRGYSSNVNTGTMKRFGLPVNNSNSRTDNSNQWYKVTIPYGKRCEKDFILKTINTHMEVPFIPVHFHYEQHKAVFYVQDRRTGDALRRLNSRITMPNGFKMILVVKDSGPPIQPMDEETVGKVKVCMSSRYDPAAKSLNLKALYEDESLRLQNLYMALNRSNVMGVIVKVIEENIPELTTLDLGSNKLFSLETLSRLVPKATNITKVNLEKNLLRSIEELDRIDKWKIEELVLDGNDLCDKFKDQSAYVSAVRKRFPKLLKLDGHTLPPPITFDLETNAELPAIKGSFFLNQEIQAVLVKFIKEYFTMYDGTDRQCLLEAYHDQALFSMATGFNLALPYKQPPLHDYNLHSRNMLKVRDSGKRNRLVKHGRLSIVAQLCQFPPTIHDLNSFVVDVSSASATLLSFSVSGVFKEADSKSDRPPIRAFSRDFVTLPSGSGMVICNDMLVITNASPDQTQTAFKVPAPTPSSSPVLEDSPTAPPFSSPDLSTEQQQMIQSFINDSGMNQIWSAKCLVQNEWNYVKAGQVFLELQRQGKIPPEAFVK